MKKILKTLCSITLLAGCMELYSSGTFSAVKAIGMGDAYTSLSGDVLSLYYNPAGIYGGKSFSLSLDVAGRYNFSGGVLGNINEIIDASKKFSKIQEYQKNGGDIDITQINALFNAIKNLNEISSPGKGVLLSLNGGLGVKIKNFGFGVKNYSIVGLKPTIDTSFYLGTTTVVSPSISRVVSMNKTEGVSISLSTGAVPSSLSEEQKKLKDVVDNFLKPELEKLGVEVPSGLTSEQIANALINAALAGGVDPVEIKEAVDKLSDPNFQNLIKSILDQNYTKQVFSKNNSGILFKGLNITEFNLSYSQQVFLPELYLGGSLRYLAGTSIYYNFLVFNETEKLDFSNIIEVKNKLTKNSNAITLDLGMLYKLPVPVVKTQAGLVVKNIIEPEFEVVNSNEKLKLPRQITVGISGELLKFLTVAVDYDLLKTPTFVSGYENQNISFGGEIKLPVLSLRGGYIKNLAAESEEMLSLGLGLKIFVLQLDFSFCWDNDILEVDNDKRFPANGSLGLRVGLEF